jgi:serine/threonine protein kinase
VAGYRIERVLGIGGMGTVYLAQNPTLPRRDALKILSAELSRNQEFRARFIREADVAAQLDHPNIVSIYRRGETDDGHLWIAMTYVGGTDADEALRAGAMTPARAVHIVNEIAKALDYAHRHNVVHRDIKPANFLLSKEGGGDERALLGDFGIARALDDVGLTATGSLVATVSYAAPEVIAGVRFDHRADLYSLGCTLFRLLTGKTPFPADAGVPAVMLAHLQQPPPRVTDLAPGLPYALDSVIATAMAKDPGQRFQTAGQLAAAASEALHAHIARETAPWQAIPSAEVSSYPSSPGATPWWQPSGALRNMMAAVSSQPAQITPPPVHTTPPRRRRRRIAAALGAVALLATGAVTAGLVMTSSTNEAATPPTIARAPAAPPLPLSALSSLLLSVDEINVISGAKFYPVPIENGMASDSDTLVQKDCAGPFLPRQQIVYNGSGWQAVAAQSIREPSGAGQPAAAAGLAPTVTQVVVGFPSADLATELVKKQQAQWAGCNRGELTDKINDIPVPISFGDFATTSDGILTITWFPEDNKDWIVGRALAARNNLAIDIDVGGCDHPLESAIDIVHKIAEKIRSN